MLEKKPGYSLRSKIFFCFIVIIFFQASVICFFKPRFYYILSGVKNYEIEIKKIWPPDEPRNLTDYLRPDENTTIIRPVINCDSSEPFLNIIVTTGVDQKDRRVGIRQTWGSRKRINDKKIVVNFLVGQTNNTNLTDLVRQEANEYGDIIQETFIDSYFNLTIKVGMMLKWIKNDCPHAKYIMKADDDVYLDLPVLVETLLKHENNSGELLLGHIVLHPPIKDEYNKWYMPDYMFSESKYPLYLGGPGYVMSQTALRKLYEKALSVTFLHLEDLFFTGICAREAHIIPINDKNFNYFAPPLGLILQHQITTTEMNLLWQIENQSN